MLKSRATIRRVFGAGLICAAVALATDADADVEILRDTWGVPHIFAEEPNDLMYGYGYAQAEDHANLLLRLYAEGRGRAAEYFGESFLPGDVWVHRMGVPQRARQWLSEQRSPYGRMLEAFAAGINAFAESHPQQIDADVRPILPVTAADVLCHYQKLIHMSFVAGVPDKVGRAAEDWARGGSNAWAIGPSRTAGGHAILLGNPHLRWDGAHTWHEAHLVSGGLNLYGATLVGLPYICIGFNDHLGWTHTVNSFDGADLFEVRKEGDAYRFDGEARPFVDQSVILKVRGAEGRMMDVPVRVRQTVHGPVAAETDRRALALRVTGWDAPHVLEQYWRMGSAANLAEFESAAAMLQMPMFTIMYADRDGHILHLFGGRTPIRSGGDWAFWRGVVPGESSSTLWREILAYEDLPRVLDPPSGWLQNANDPPWTTTFPREIDRRDFPPYLAPDWSGPFLQFRAQRSARLLMEGDRALSLDDVVRLKHSTRVELADRLLDDLAAAVGEHGDTDARRAMQVLEQWDRCAEADSRGAVLFLRFMQRFGMERFAVAWSNDAPLDTPDGIADPAFAAAALGQAARALEGEGMALDVPWGEVHRLRFGRMDEPANGGPGALGIFRNVEYAGAADGRFRAMGGDSFIMVVEFADPVRAMTLIPYGNSSQPLSPHCGDQFALFARKQLRDVWRTRADIEANLESIERLHAR